MQNPTEKVMPFKTTANWIFNDIWCYLVIGCFDWKLDVFQKTVLRGLLCPQKENEMLYNKNRYSTDLVRDQKNKNKNKKKP